MIKLTALAGVLTLIADIAFVWVPASRWGGHLAMGPAVWLTLLAFALLAAAVAAKLVKENRRSNGAVADGLRFMGAAYLGYRVFIGAARGVYHDITED